MKKVVLLKKYHIIRNIEEGEHLTSAKLIEDIFTHEKYVAKIIYSSYNHPKLYSELQILSNLYHPTINNMIGYSHTTFTGEKWLTLILEYASNGNLQNFLKTNDIDNTTRQIIITGIARSILFLHEHNMVHKDIDSHKILIDDQMRPHLSITAFVEMKDNSQLLASKLFYMAPETWIPGDSGGEVDIYSFAILMYEIVTGNRPYDDLEHMWMLNEVPNGRRPVFTSPIKETIKKMIEQCWCGDPDKRPSAKELFTKLSSDPDYILDDVDRNIFDEYVKSIL